MLGTMIGDLYYTKQQMDAREKLTDISLATLSFAKALQENYMYDCRKIKEIVNLANKNQKKFFSDYSFSLSAVISPISWYARDIFEVESFVNNFGKSLEKNQKEIYEAITIAKIIYYARIGKTKQFIQQYIERSFSDGLSDNLTLGNLKLVLSIFLQINTLNDGISRLKNLNASRECYAMYFSLYDAFYRNINLEYIEELLKVLEENNCSSIMYDFLNYQMFRSTNSEEITNETYFLCDYYKDNEEISAEWYYSNKLRALAYPIFYNIIGEKLGNIDDYTNIGIEEFKFRQLCDCLIDMYFTNDAKKNSFKVFKELYNKLMNVKSFDEFAKYVEIINKEFERIGCNMRLLIFKTKEEAIKFIDSEFKVDTLDYRQIFNEYYRIKL